MTSSKTLTIMIARTAAGKTTLSKIFKSEGYLQLMSYTTRPFREGGSDLEEYIFLSKENFDLAEKQAEFVVNEDWKYGVDLSLLPPANYFFSAISASYACDIANAAIEQGFDSVKIFILNLDQDIRRQRLVERGESEESIERRFKIEFEEGEYSLPEISKSVGNNASVTILNTGNLSPQETYDFIKIL